MSIVHTVHLLVLFFVNTFLEHLRAEKKIAIMKMQSNHSDEDSVFATHSHSKVVTY